MDTEVEGVILRPRQFNVEVGKMVIPVNRNGVKIANSLDGYKGVREWSRDVTRSPHLHGELDVDSTEEAINLPLESRQPTREPLIRLIATEHDDLVVAIRADIFCVCLEDVVELLEHRSYVASKSVRNADSKPPIVSPRRSGCRHTTPPIIGTVLRLVVVCLFAVWWPSTAADCVFFHFIFRRSNLL